MKKTIILFLLLVLFVSLSASSFKKNITEYLEEKNLSKSTIVFAISMLPIFELRGAIPIGITQFDLPYYKVVPLSILGNMVPILFILLLFKYVTLILMKIPFFKKILEKIFERTRKKGKVVEKYEELGLVLLVAIPLPITGAWTGSLVAYLFGLDIGKSLFYIFLGVCGAALIVTTLTSLGWIGGIIAITALLILILKAVFGIKKKQNYR